MRKISPLIAALSAITASSITCAGPLEYFLLQQRDKQQSLTRAVSTTRTEYYPQLIDHAKPELGTFQQRYYVDETFSSGNDAPVFFYICGESTCYSSALNGEIRSMARQYGAKMVALEHRYYGKSMPVKTLSTNDLQYLSTDYALKDLARFQKHMMHSKNWQGKWVAFGGSYPGSLSAYYRLKYPELVAGSLASSAPVQAKENFEEYDAHVTKVAGPKCAALMRDSYRQIEASLSDSKKIAELKHAFGVDSLRDNQDFLYLVADIGAAAVQYGYKPRFCELLSAYESPLTGYEQFAKEFYSMWGVSDPISLTMQGAESENPADYADGLGMRQWFYQSCREYGYWQNANADPEKSTRSAMINPEYHHGVCERLFAIDEVADTDYINNTFYKPLLTAPSSNIFFTNGSTDPWSVLSISDRNGNDVNKANDYYVIEGAAHCDDLHSPRFDDSEQLKTARTKLSAHITDWLTAAKRMA